MTFRRFEPGDLLEHDIDGLLIVVGVNSISPGFGDILQLMIIVPNNHTVPGYMVEEIRFDASTRSSYVRNCVKIA